MEKINEYDNVHQWGELIEKDLAGWHSLTDWEIKQENG